LIFKSQKYLLILLICISLKAQTHYSTSNLNTNDNFFNKKNISVIALSAGFAGSLIGAYVTWWKDDFGPFRFYEGEWLHDPGLNGIDKAGHFYTSYMFYKIQRDLLLWGEHSKEFSSNVSALLSLSFAVIVEVGDAFTPYGFDYQDLTFNLGGLGYGILQDKISFLKNFNFKWSYIPKRNFTFPPKFSEDYDGHIYWLTINLHNLLKSSIGNFWPEIIQPAIGFSVEEKGNRREFIIGIDFNIFSLFNNANEDWQFAGKAIDLFHIPAPGIKYSPSAKPVYRLFLLN
jgi:hypothetical protein